MNPKRTPHTSTQPSPNESATNKTERIRSILILPSRAKSEELNLEGAEETEIAAQISVPQEGGWGWVVVAASFINIFILDGVVFTFGSVFSAITEEFKIDQALIGLINSIAVALYCSFGPLGSALINRFGFRVVAMSGSVISSFSLFFAYLSNSYVALCIFYGFFAGMGYCFINMGSALIVGFYFERLRALALAISLTGSSVGIMVMYPVNTYLVKLSGWRTLLLLQSGLLGIIYFMGMTFKPLLSLTVTKTTDDPTRTVTYLPNLSTPTMKAAPSRAKADNLLPSTTEKMFSAVSNSNFPTAAAVVDEGVSINTAASNQAGVPGPSATAPASRLTLTANVPKGGMSQRQLKQVQSIMSKSNLQQRAHPNIELTVKVDQPEKKVGCCGRICRWEPHVPESRPMYRDDAFFDGSVTRLPVYQKSMMDASNDHKTGLEYQLAVSRAATTVDLKERKGVCTTAVRRILATMMDPKLLKRCSFILFVSGVCVVSLGVLVPYIFLQNRNKDAGILESHCSWFISVIGFANAIGRLVLGALACKIDPFKLLIFSCFITGGITILSNFSFNVYFQYLFSAIFGFFVAGATGLRTMVLVNLYGLDKLTNATGMMYLFQGVAFCISTPLATTVKTSFGFPATFYFSGGVICLSGVLLLPVKILCLRENRKEHKLTKPIKTQNEENPAPVAVRKRPK